MGFLEHRAIVVRGELDRPVVTKIRRREETLHFLGAHPHLGSGSAGLTENDRLLARPLVPVDNGKLPAGPENRSNGSHETLLSGTPWKVLAISTKSTDPGTLVATA